jgi:L,D-peptidoglycan transpeptidase YkuD (ErfK/YbiS/YcfS/YnhG family)
MKTQGRSPLQAPKIVVRSLSAGATQGVVTYGNLRFPCALGRTGRRPGKREGDGATPTGEFALRSAHYRPDRLSRPQTSLSVHPLRPLDGWCDAADDRNYNRPVRRPYPASAEEMWRADGLYDLVVVMGYNDRPRVKGRGSAVFMHVARPGMRPTEGCVALARPHLLRLLQAVRRGAVVSVRPKRLPYKKTARTAEAPGRV